MRRCQPISRARPTRGIAMLLVLISLMTATVLTTAYLASRDNSSAIGQNVASGVAARWAADSGLKIGEAILQTEADWRSMGGGKLVDDLDLNGAKIDVDVTDVATRLAPTSATQSVSITSTAEYAGVTQVATATAFVPVSSNTVDLDLSEFAAFAANSLSMQNKAVVTRWPNAPLSKLGERVPIGTRATGASSIVMSDKAAMIDASVYTPPGASNSIVSNADSPAPVMVKLLDSIPFPQPPGPGELPPILSLNPNLKMSGGTATITTNTAYNAADIANSAVRIIRGNVKMIVDQDLTISSRSKLIIDGKVKMVVWGNLDIEEGAIEVTPNGKLLLFVRGSGGGQAVELKNGYIGNLRTEEEENNGNDSSGSAVWMNPNRIMLFSVAPMIQSGEWRFEAKSVIKGSIYAPHASQILIRDLSAVYGRIATTSMTLRDHAAIFFDPALDNRMGYAHLESPVYDVNGKIKPAIMAVSSLDPGLLQPLADLLSLVIQSPTDPNAKVTPALAVIAPPETVPATEPTPRPVVIEFKLVSVGTKVQTWEMQ